MPDVPCRVTADLNSWLSSQWDCTCADGVEPNDLENLCSNCFYNHSDYEPDYETDGD